jgi:hypothetical protein
MIAIIGALLLLVAADDPRPQPRPGVAARSALTFAQKVAAFDRAATIYKLPFAPKPDLTTEFELTPGRLAVTGRGAASFHATGTVSVSGDSSYVWFHDSDSLTMSLATKPGSVYLVDCEFLIQSPNEGISVGVGQTLMFFDQRPQGGHLVLPIHATSSQTHLFFVKGGASWGHTWHGCTITPQQPG